MLLRKIDKRGVMGIDAARGFVIGILVLVILGVVAIIVFNSLGNATTTVASNTVTNESSAWANGTAYVVDDFSVDFGTSYTLTDAWSRSVLTDAPYDFQYTNLAANLSLDSTTGTLTNLTVLNSTLQGNLSISYTYNTPSGAGVIITNASDATRDFFENVTTWLTLISILIIILIIAAVVLVVNRMGGSREGGL